MADDGSQLYELAMKVVEAARPLRTNYSPYGEPPAVAVLREALREFDAVADDIKKQRQG